MFEPSSSTNDKNEEIFQYTVEFDYPYGDFTIEYIVANKGL